MKNDLHIKQTEWEKWMFPLTFKNILLIFLGTAINLCGSKIALYLSLPLWLDSIGTFFTAICLGPIAGALSGSLMNVILNFWYPNRIWYAIVSICGGLTIGRFFPRHKKMRAFPVIATSFAAAIVMIIVSTPLNLLFYAGYTGNSWGDALIDMTSNYITLPVICCVLGEMLVEIPDKVLSMLLSVLFLSVLKHCTDKAGTPSHRKKGAAAQNILFFFLLGWLLLPASPSVFAAELSSDYISVTYNIENGLDSAEINAILQTADGYLWAGSYSGLYRYNGSHFEKISFDEQISNAIILFEDSKKRLWIGTNDSGVYCCDPAEEHITHYSMEEGLSANSIRSICEDDHGRIYVSTTAELCRINTDESIFVYADLPELSCTYSLISMEDGQIAGVTRNGLLFFLKEDTISASMENINSEYAFSSVAQGDAGELLVGTTGKELVRIRYDGTRLKKERTIPSKQLSAFNSILYSAGMHGYFLASDTGFGFLDSTEKIEVLSKDGFNSAVNDIFIDSQDNIWFSSTKQGILKLSPNVFTDIFKKAGLSPSAVNATLIDDDLLYIGTDLGLIIYHISEDTTEENDLSRIFEGTRIRHILKDRDGNLWFCTYGQMGLVKITPKENIQYYNSSTCDILGNRFRFTLELANGDILAASTDGLSILRKGIVYHTIGTKDGLIVPQILCALQLEDGSILAGSDGDGIYVIKDYAISDKIDTEDGLLSHVVLRILPCQDGLLYVASNGIYFQEPEGTIRKLSHFPYNNNYDIFLTKDEEAWITGSAGIYVVKTADLISDSKEYPSLLLNRTWGFDTTLTANAFSTAHNNDLYFCCTDGVRRVNLSGYHTFSDQYQILIDSFTADEESVPKIEGIYQVPAGSGKIQIQPAVLNYSASNPQITCYLEGFDSAGVTVKQSDLAPMYYTSLPFGDYTLNVKVLDGTDQTVIKSASFPIHKEARLYEHFYYKLYVAFVGAMIIGFLAWMAAEMSNMAVINRQYDQIRAAKEEAEFANQAKSRFLAQMSHEIRTPINAVLGMDEMILRESREKEIRGYAADIYTAGNTLLSLINEILDSSKIESGKMEIVPVEYELSVLIRDLGNMISQRAQAKDLHLLIEAESDLPGKLYGDDVRIRQVITNLLTNAVKYTPSGTVWFRVRGSREDEDELLHFEVEDTGMGIKEEDLPKLFEAYQRIEEDRNRNIEGTGLGMNITIQLLRLMDSQLEVESVYGKGSKFYFDLRQKIVDDTPIGDLNSQPDSSKDTYRYEGGFLAPDAKILVVDDNAMNRKVFKSLLKITQIQVTEAGGGLEAIELAKQECFNLIFTDHMMPDMDGVETMQHLRTLPNCQNVPIYVLTANAITGAKEQYLEAGFDGFVSKPIVSEQLEQVILAELPKELILPREMDDAAPAFSPEELPVIDGLDWHYAWLHLPDEDLLSSTVEDFYDVISLQSEKLQSMFLELFAREASFDSYRIQVHAMKSSAATIGILPLAGMAKILEYAARDHDTDTIASLHPVFLREWNSYQEKLIGVFRITGKSTGYSPKKTAADADMLLAMFSMLRSALEDFDIDTADEIADKLTSYRYPEDIETLLPILIAAIKDMDSEEAEKIMNKMEELL